MAPLALLPTEKMHAFRGQPKLVTRNGISCTSVSTRTDFASRESCVKSTGLFCTSSLAGVNLKRRPILALSKAAATTASLATSEYEVDSLWGFGKDMETVNEEVSSGRKSLHVAMYDTTLRDGSQMVGISLSVADKFKIAKLLVELGVDYIEGGWPGSNPKDAEFFGRWNEVMGPFLQSFSSARSDLPGGRPQVKLAAFGATRYKFVPCEKDANVQALAESGATVITLVAKAWDAQVERVLEAPLEENMAMIEDTVRFFKDMGREVMVDLEHFFDGFTANREYALRCVQTAARAGADVVVLCDTNGGGMPWSVEEATRDALLALSDWPGVQVGIHTHNDCDMGVANSISAVRAGASVVQGCINGYGERTGNANLVSVIGGLQVKLGRSCIPPCSLPELTRIATAIAEIASQPLNQSQPFVGSNAFAHKGGIHVAALRKMPESYNHCDPTIVGNSMRSVVSDLSGRGNILDKAEKAGLVLDREGAGRVLARIKEMEREGCAFENAAASVDMLIVRRGSSYIHPFRVLEFSVIASNRGAVISRSSSSSSTSSFTQEGNGRVWQEAEGTEKDDDWMDGGESSSQAIVKVRVGSIDQMSAAEGKGPVDALSHALRSALEVYYPQLARVDLVDYSVRLVEPVGSRCGTMSTTRVTIEFSDRLGNSWSTVGAHSSIVEASFRALVDGLEFGIVNCSEDGCKISS